MYERARLCPYQPLSVCSPASNSSPYRKKDNMGSMESILSDMHRLCGTVLMDVNNDTLVMPICGMMDFQSIKATLNTFRQRFAERGGVDWENDAVDRCYQALKDPLVRLDEFFQNIQGREFDIEYRQNAFCVASVLQREIDQLRDVARQLDVANRAESEVPEAGSEGQEVIDLGHIKIILTPQD